MPSTEIPGLPADLAALAGFLREVAPRAGPLDRLDLLTGGSSNLTLLAVCARRRIVLRRRPIGPIPEQAHDMRREYETLRMLAPTPVPVPVVYGYCADETALGAPYYAMEFVPGTVVQTAVDLLPSTAADRTRICVDLVRVLAELHAIPLPDFPAYQPGRSSHVLERHLRRWHDRWTERPHRALPEVDRLAGELRARLPADEVTFVHGDYRLGNVLVDSRAERPVLAVLDWELATFGHPLTDLAHLLAYWEGTGAICSHPAQRIAAEAGLPSAHHLAGIYAGFSGRSTDQLPVFLAFEHWRAAIIKEAIYQRRVHNGATAGQIEDARTGVDRHLAEAAARLEAC